MISDVLIDDSDLVETITAIDRHDQSVSKAAAKSVTEWHPEAMQSLQTYPGKPSYPLRWFSEKQRIVVLAKLRKMYKARKGGTIAYVRTGTLARQWSMSLLTENREPAGNVTVWNLTSYAKYVYGPRQQPFHEDTGWFLFTKKMVELSGTLASKMFGAVVRAVKEL